MSEQCHAVAHQRTAPMTLQHAVRHCWRAAPAAWGAAHLLAMDDDDAVIAVQVGGQAWAALANSNTPAMPLFDPRLLGHAELQRVLRDAAASPTALVGLAMFWLAYDAKQGLPLAPLMTFDPYFVLGAHAIWQQVDPGAVHTQTPSSGDTTLAEDARNAARHARLLHRWSTFLESTAAARLAVIADALARDLPWEFATLTATVSPSLLRASVALTAPALAAHSTAPEQRPASRPRANETPFSVHASVVFEALVPPPVTAAVQANVGACA